MSEITLRSLEGRYYTDPEIYAREQQGLLARTWQYAGHRSQVPNVGDFFTFEIAGESLFITHDRDGSLRCFYNVCQHRAHELVSGTGNAKVIVCPYHAWTYRLDGKFLNGPNVRAVPDFPRDKICLTSAKVEDFHGFLFVNLDPDAAPMDEWFPGAREELLAFCPQIEELAPLEWVEVPEDCNWKVSIENYSECYHCSLCHPTFSSGVVKPETYNIAPQGYCLRHTTECVEPDQMSYPIDLEANENAGKYSSWFLWPMFSFQVYPGNLLNTYHWRPKSVDEVVLYRGWYSVGGHEDSIARQMAIQDRQTTVAEDITLIESVHRGLKSRGYVPGPLVLDPNEGVQSEHSVAALQRWMREGIDA